MTYLGTGSGVNPVALGGPTRDVARARRGLVVVFLIFGMFNGSWISRIPFVAEDLRLDTAQLSVALLAMPIGQVLAAQVVPRLVRRVGSGVVARAALVAAAACLVLPGLAWNLGSLAVGLGLFGLSMGILDITMNAQGVAVERSFERPVMSGLHGFFSIGAFAGAGLGAAAAAAGVAPTLHFAAVGAVLALAGLLATRRLLGAAADRTNPLGDVQGDPAARSPSLLRQPFLLVLGAIALCAFFAEGAVDNWSGLYLRDSLGSSLAVAPYGAAASGAGMALGRFAGDRLVARWGAQRVLEVCAALASVGMVLSVAAPGPTLAVVGYGIFGLGSSTLVPIVFTLAGNVEGVEPAWAISRVTSIGFCGLFGAPPIIGLVADATSLRLGLGVAALFISLVLPLSFAAQRLRRDAAATNALPTSAAPAANSWREA